MAGARISEDGGIRVELEGRVFMLDPSGPTRADYAFVSHAHVDHMHKPSKSEKVISSQETRELAAARGFDLGATTQDADGVELLDSGHILGSRALRLQEEVYYTGDASGRERAFLARCKTKQARLLIMETTYGRPEYVFPSTAKLVGEVNDLIGQLYHRGRPVVLMGYPLGKAQLLNYFFSGWEPLYVHDRVADMNEVHMKHGVALKAGTRYNPEADSDSLPPGPWLMIAPMSSGRSRAMAHLRQKYGAALIAFSGWALNEGYARSLGADFAFPVSDHCDYPELLKIAREVSPEVVYTTHGFAREFSHDLRKLGFSARTLDSGQSSLHEYTRKE
ncbi:MAG: hypothetical protein LYZ70_06395 [Nitrososphaerales archaeon]|nr:hypothetical protein [Nitrososphaerales archaeon]